MLSITILLQKLYSSSLVFAMLGAYNNTVKNPDPEKIKKIKPISTMLSQHCRPCCYYTSTVTFLTRWSTNICPKHAMSQTKLESTQVYCRNREKESQLQTERVRLRRKGW